MSNKTVKETDGSVKIKRLHALQNQFKENGDVLFLLLSAEKKSFIVLGKYAKKKNCYCIELKSWMFIVSIGME